MGLKHAALYIPFSPDLLLVFHHTDISMEPWPIYRLKPEQVSKFNEVTYTNAARWIYASRQITLPAK